MLPDITRGLAYYLSGELDEELFFPYQSVDFKRLNARFYSGQATRILPAEKMVELNPATRLSFDRLLIATGAQAQELTVPGANLPGLYKLDHLEDARAILAQAKRGRTAIVTGGGITALELAEGLAARHLKVHYVFRSERYWPNVLDETESRIIEIRLQNEGIQLHKQSEIVENLGKNGKLNGVRLASGQHLPCDLLAYAIGILPRTALAKSAGLACERGILVDGSMQTNLPDIYAAGDVAQAYDPASGKYLLDSLWSSAREQGRVAGLTTTTTTIIGAVGAGRDADLLGIARGDSETWRQLPEAISAQGGFDINRLRLMLAEKHLLGAIVMGDQKLSRPLQALVRQKTDISAIRSQLLAPNAPIADILVDFYSRSQVLNNPT